MARNPVSWFEIYVQDMQRAKDFYESVFQFKLTKLADASDASDASIEMWGFPMDMSQMGASGSLVRMEGGPSGGNTTMVYFSCADCAVEIARVVPAGGKVVRDKFSIGQYGFIALAMDTEGTMIGLHSLT